MKNLIPHNPSVLSALNAPKQDETHDDMEIQFGSHHEAPVKRQHRSQRIFDDGCRVKRTHRKH